MGFFSWIGENWFTLLETVSIVAGLFFTAFSLRIDTKVRHVGNLLTITQQHREIWSEFYKKPELARVLDAKTNPDTAISNEEQLFLKFLILHLNSAFRAMKSGMFLSPEGLRADVREFFVLPIPKRVWEKMEPLQDRDFVTFVESCRTDGLPPWIRENRKGKCVLPADMCAIPKEKDRGTC